MLSGSRDNTLRLWDVGSGRCLRTFDGHTNDVTSVVFSPDGRQALSGGMEALRLWEVASGKCLRRFAGHTEWVLSVAFSPNGRQALSGGEEGTLRLWETASGKCLHILPGNGQSIRSVAWSVDPTVLLAASGHSVQLWHVDWELLPSQNEPVRNEPLSLLGAAADDRQHEVTSGVWPMVLTPPTVLRANDPSTFAVMSRNAPCPCGSGKKYKHCHGAGG